MCFKDCCINMHASERSSYWWISVLDKNNIMRTKGSKQLLKNVTEKPKVRGYIEEDCSEFVTRLEKACLLIIPVKPDRTWTVLQRRMGYKLQRPDVQRPIHTGSMPQYRITFFFFLYFKCIYMYRSVFETFSVSQNERKSQIKWTIIQFCNKKVKKFRQG